MYNLGITKHFLGAFWPTQIDSKKECPCSLIKHAQSRETDCFKKMGLYVFLPFFKTTLKLLKIRYMLDPSNSNWNTKLELDVS